MIILVNQNIERLKYDHLLLKSKFSSPFQTLEFYSWFNTVKGYNADVFAVEVNSEYTALCVVTIQKERGIKSYFSRRGIVYGGPTIIDDDQESFSFLLRSISDYYKRKLIYIEIRNSFSYTSLSNGLDKIGWVYQKHLNVQLNVVNKSLDDVLALMTYNRRREVKMSFKAGTVVSVAVLQDEVIELYHILEDLYTTKVKLPLPDIDYFLSFINSSIAKIFIVKHKEKIVGGSFCITDNKNSINTLYYAGLRDYDKRVFPTHIAIIGVIQYAIDNRIKIIDFMGAGRPDIKYGVRDFKLQFGGQLVEHGRFIKILNPLLFKIGVLGLKLLSKII